MMDRDGPSRKYENADAIRAMTSSNFEHYLNSRSKFSSCELERVRCEAGAQRCYLKTTAFIGSKS